LVSSWAGLMTLLLCSVSMVGCSNGQPPIAGPAASWQSLLSTAQKEAERVSDSPALIGVYSLPDQLPISTLDSNQALQVEFVFVTEKGDGPIVTLNDVDPPTVVQVQEKHNLNEFSPEALDRLEGLLRGVTLSPREIYQRTIEEGKEFAKREGKRIIPYFSLLLDKDWQSHVGVPLVWTADYSTGSSGLLMSIHPETGETLKKEER
jgi:hypothetical protein